MTAILVFKCTEGAGVGDYSPLARKVVLTLMHRQKRKALDLDGK